MVIIINGSRNSGKTTISKLLAKKLDQTANIEVDNLRWFLPFLNLEQTIPINLENAVLTTKNLLGKGFNVIINYCLREKDYKYLNDKLKAIAPKIYTITLKPKLKIALSNRGRKITSDDRKRIKEQYGKGKHRIPEVGLVIDSSDKTASEVVNLILKYIDENKV